MHQLTSVIGISLLLAVCAQGSVSGDISPCNNGTVEAKEGALECSGYAINSTYEWDFNITLGGQDKVYFAFEKFDLDVGDSLEVSYLMNDTIDGKVQKVFKGKREPFILVTSMRAVTVVVTTGSAESGASLRRFTATYSTKRCNLNVDDSTHAISSPIYSLSQGSIVCTYNITAQPNNIIALSFDKVNLTKSKLSAWDGNSDKAAPILNYTGTDKHVSDVVTSQRSLFLEAYLPAVSNESFTAFLTIPNQNCSGMIALDNAQTISSSGYPGNYTNNVECRWVLSVPEGSTIKVNISSLQLADQFDQLILNQGDSRKSPPWLSMAVGSKPEALLMTHANKLWIQFTSDNSLVAKGFNITLTPQEYGGAMIGSGRIELKRKGSNDEIKDRSTTGDVYYQLTAAEGMQVKLVVNSSVLFPTASIEIHDGSQLSDPVIASFRSQVPFYPVVSSKENMLVVARNFVNNGSMTRQNFIADFISVPPGSQKSFVEDSGSVTLKARDLKGSAAWIILNSQKDREVVLEINQLVLPPTGNNTVKVYRGLDSLSVCLHTFTSSQTFIPVIYTPNARIEYNTDGQNLTDPDQILLSFSYRIIPVCGMQNMTSTRGVLTSPGYPNQYPFNARCEWTMPVQDKMMHLEFKKLAIFEEHLLTLTAVYNRTVTVNNQTTINITTKTLSRLSGLTLPDDLVIMNNKSFNMTKVKVTFSSTFKGHPDDFNVNYGFNILYENLGCGGQISDPKQSLKTPGFPSAVTKNTTCLWMISLPPQGVKDNTSVNIINYKISISHFANNTSTSKTMLEMHDGGSQRAAPVSLTLKEGTSDALQSRTNKLYIRYTFTSTAPASKADKGFSFNVDYSTYVCPKSQQCKNGLCMHKSWVCNGIDECGDDSDEQDCLHATNKVSRMVLGFSIAITFVLAIALACVVPALYRRFKYPNYSELRDLMTPVPT